MNELKVKLPTIDDLYSEVPEILEKRNQLNVLLNHEPKNSWLKPHPIAKVKREVDGVKFDVPVLFIPIERIEFLLTAIYKSWRVEVKNFKIIANSICVDVRLHVLDPISNEWSFQDGLGAQPIQTDRDAGAIDFNKIKSNAIQLALPSAESYAVKDAAEKLGKIFGKDMNRADQINYNQLSPEIEKAKIQKRLGEVLKNLDSNLAETYYQKIEAATDKGIDTIQFYKEILFEIKPSENDK